MEQIPLDVIREDVIDLSLMASAATKKAADLTVVVDSLQQTRTKMAGLAPEVADRLIKAEVYSESHRARLTEKLASGDGLGALTTFLDVLKDAASNSVPSSGTQVKAAAGPGESPIRESDRVWMSQGMALPRS